MSETLGTRNTRFSRELSRDASRWRGKRRDRLDVGAKYISVAWNSRAYLLSCLIIHVTKTASARYLPFGVREERAGMRSEATGAASPRRVARLSARFLASLRHVGFVRRARERGPSSRRSKVPRYVYQCRGVPCQVSRDRLPVISARAINRVSV